MPDKIRRAPVMESWRTLDRLAHEPGRHSFEITVHGQPVIIDTVRMFLEGRVDSIVVPNESWIG